MKITSNQPYRLALCLPTITQGAETLQQKLIAKGLTSRGHDLSYVVPLDLDDVIYTKELQNQSLARRTWSRAGWFNFVRKNSWRLQKLLSIPYLNVFSNYCFYDACLQCLPGHDIVQERNGLYKMGVAMASKRLKLPYLLFFDADDIFELDFLGQPITGILRWRAKQVIQYTLKAADGIVTVSGATRRRLINVWKVPPEKIAVFPNAVDVDVFRPYPDQKVAVRARYGLGDQPFVLYVGNFYAWHDVRTLIDGFVQVLKVYPDAHLLLVGNGKQRAEMEQHANDIGAQNSIKFTGFLPWNEIPPLISAADVAVSPYPKMEQEWWGSSMKLFEYMASGTSLIASNVGEQVTEVIQDGINGLLVPPGDDQALARALLDLIGDPNRRNLLGQKARADAIDRHSWDIYIQRLESVHNAVMRRQPIHLI